MIIILMHIKLVHLSHFFKEFVVQYMSVLCHCSFVESIALYNTLYTVLLKTIFVYKLTIKYIHFTYKFNST